MKPIFRLFTAVIFLVFFSCDSRHLVKDADGHEYETVQIGKQLWMKQNFRGGQFSDRTTIPTNPLHWENITSGACCNYNGDEKNDAISGKLYNFYALEKGLRLPKGWRISTEKDWNNLINFLGEKTAGDKLKTTWGWNKLIDCEPIKNKNNNSSGFSALATGFRVNGNNVDSCDESCNGAFFWVFDSGLNQNHNTEVYYTVGHNYANIDYKEVEGFKNWGMSVRLIHE